MLKSVSAIAVFAVMGFGLTACSQDLILEGDPSMRATYASAGGLQAGVGGPQASIGGLQGGDRIRITVYGEDKLTGDYDIDPAGYVSLPLAGTIKAAGLSKTELERVLAKKFAGQYLKDPKVTVDIATFRPFYVLGEVQKPGEYPYKSGINVLRAIAIAGGQTYRASNSKVMIQRAGETEMREYSLSDNVDIYPGDLIRLPERYF